MASLGDRRPLVVGLRYSPWTERALWALDHHGIEYRYEEHLVLLGMPRLRWQTGLWKAPLTVPLLLEGSRRELDSFDIAHYADEKGAGEKLIEGLNPAELAECVADAEVAADALRARWVDHVLETPQAQLENVPAWTPMALRSLLKPLVRTGTRYIAREFRINDVPRGEREQELRGVLNRLRWKLHKSAFNYVLGNRFSWADIVSCGVLQAVKPVSDAWVKLPPSMREGATQASLAADFSDLLQWRDKMYDRHRSGRRRG